MKTPRTKLKTPEKLQGPMTKVQIPKKLQFPNSELQRARLGPKFHPQMIPDTIEPYIESGTAFVGTVDDIRRKMSAVQTQMNPEYFLWLCDQGYLPLHQVKKQLELFGRKVMPEFIG